MDEKKEVIDLSSLMLFEATGDSDAISEIDMVAVDADMGGAEDDALSCSCNDLMDCELSKFDDDDDGDGDADEEEEVDIDQEDWTSGDDEVVLSSAAKAGQHKKSRVCIDSATELMNETEKSKLFWEACLTS